MTTPTAIRTATLTEFGITESQLTASGPSRPAAADFARAVLIRLLIDSAGMGLRDASIAAGFRTKEAGAELLARLAAGVYDTSPALPPGRADAAAVVTAVATAADEEPI